jgi:hypothetical protein
MTRFEWNALRVGDPVRIHRNGRALEPGTVALIDASHGSFGLGIRVASAGGGQEVLWPSRVTVHGETGDTDDAGAPCLRCAALLRGLT